MIKIKSEKYYSVGDLAKILECSISSARRRLKKIEHMKDGMIKIPGHAIIKYIIEHTYISEKI